MFGETFTPSPVQPQVGKCSHCDGHFSRNSGGKIPIFYDLRHAIMIPSRIYWFSRNMVRVQKNFGVVKTQKKTKLVKGQAEVWKHKHITIRSD